MGNPTAAAAALVAVALGLGGCGAANPLKKNSKPAAAATPDGGPALDANATLDNLVALGPNGLALKVRAAFGRNMTAETVNGNPLDYLQVNAGLFTGAISPDPYSVIPSQLQSISYFMAVAGLSEVVSNNYAAALAAGAAGVIANSCLEAAGAEAIVRVIFPPINPDDLKVIAAELLKSCTDDGVAPTVRAAIESYAFVLKTQS